MTKRKTPEDKRWQKAIGVNVKNQMNGTVTGRFSSNVPNFKEVERGTSAKMSELHPCLCRNHMPYRMQGAEEGGELEFTLGCMMCGRYATGATPRECMDKWNETCAEVKNDVK